MKKRKIGKVLQKIYDSEIHLRIGWLWDGGFSYSIGTTSNDLWRANEAKVWHTLETDIEKAMDMICEHIVEEYPKSAFTKWYKN